MTRFTWWVEASSPNVKDPEAGHRLYGDARRLGVPEQPKGKTPHAWFYVRGAADIDPSQPGVTEVIASSNVASCVLRLEGD